MAVVFYYASEEEKKVNEILILFVWSNLQTQCYINMLSYIHYFLVQRLSILNILMFSLGFDMKVCSEQNP